MGSRISKPNNAEFITNPNPFTYFSTIDSNSALHGQPFIQLSDQKNPSVPLVDENEPTIYNIVNLVEPSHLRTCYSSLTPYSFNPYFFSNSLFTSLPSFGMKPLVVSSAVPVIAPSDQTPLISPLISPPLAMPNIYLNPQSVLLPLYNKLLMRSAMTGYSSSSSLSLAMPFFENLFHSKYSFTQLGQPLTLFI